MIKLCSVGSLLDSTPFYPLDTDPPTPFSRVGRELLEQHGIQFCGAAEADILVSATARGLWGSLFRYGRRKRYLIWTLNPRLDTGLTSKRRYPLLPSIQVMNLYGDVLENNYFDFPSAQFLKPLRSIEDFGQRPRQRRIAALMPYATGRRLRLPYRGRDLDLCNLRSHIALAGRQEDRVDIYGEHWPSGVLSATMQRVSEMIKGDRHQRLKLLSGYYFALCLEDVNWPNYCSASLWQAIQAGCLPIYFGQDNCIYDDFPARSFIDYAQFDGPEELFWFIEELLPEEFRRRYNRCVEAFNRALERHAALKPAEQVIHKTLARLREMMA